MEIKFKKKEKKKNEVKKLRKVKIMKSVWESSSQDVLSRPESDSL